MAEKPNQTPEGNEPAPTPKGTEGEKAPKETKPEGEGSPPEGDVDYKKKFSDSSRENQRILQESKLKDEKNAELETKLAEASKTPPEEELAKKYPDWEYKEEEDKERIRKAEETEKRLRKIEEATAWEADYKSLIVNPEFASLKEKEAEFKEFAYKYPKSVDLPTLAKSFLYDNKPEPEAAPRKGLEKPTGGGPEQAPASEMSLEDIGRLRKENPKLYIKMIQEGKLKDIPEE